MDRFGDVLYNLYGSTEVAWATIAGPGRPARRARARRPPAARDRRAALRRARQRDGARGTTGRIFVGNEMAFDGYTGGGGKDVIDGLMSTGDVGHFDADGRLFIDGRDDEMIVSGGENVFPREVEDLLADHPGVVEVAVVGVPDEAWGERLRAFVVPVEGMELTADDLKAYVKENLAGFKVPRDVVFLDELPRNATGKVLKRACLVDASLTAAVSGAPLDRAADRLGLGRPTGRPGEHVVERAAQPGGVLARVLAVAVRRAAVGEPALAVEHEDVGRRLRAVGVARRPASRRAGRASASRRDRASTRSDHRLERVARVALGVVAVDRSALRRRARRSRARRRRSGRARRARTGSGCR